MSAGTGIAFVLLCAVSVFASVALSVGLRRREDRRKDRQRTDAELGAQAALRHLPFVLTELWAQMDCYQQRDVLLYAGGLLEAKRSHELAYVGQAKVMWMPGVYEFDASEIDRAIGSGVVFARDVHQAQGVVARTHPQRVGMDTDGVLHLMRSERPTVTAPAPRMTAPVITPGYGRASVDPEEPVCSVCKRPITIDDRAASDGVETWHSSCNASRSADGAAA